MYTYDSVEISRISKILRNMVTDLEMYCVKVGYTIFDEVKT